MAMNPRLLRPKRAGAAALAPGPSFSLTVEGNYFSNSQLNIYGYIFGEYEVYEWQQNDGSGWVTVEGQNSDLFQIAPDQPFGPMQFRARVAPSGGEFTDWGPVYSLPLSWQPYGTTQNEVCSGDPDYRCCTDFADGSGGSFVSCGGTDSYGTSNPVADGFGDNGHVVTDPSSANFGRTSLPYWAPFEWGGSPPTRFHRVTYYSTASPAVTTVVQWAWDAATPAVLLDCGDWNFDVEAISAGGTLSGAIGLQVALPPLKATGISSGLSGGSPSVTLGDPAAVCGNDLLEYRIQYSTNSGATWSQEIAYSYNDASNSGYAYYFQNLPAVPHVFRVAWVNAVGVGPYSDTTESVTPPPAFSGLAVILTSGTSYAVPSGATAMKAWAVGSGGTGDGWYSFSGNAGGCAYKTWSVSGGQSVAYTRSDNGNSTVTFGGVTITGNAGPRNSRSQTGAGFSGGDGGAAGGVFTNNDPVMRGGAVGGNGSSASTCNRWRATNVSGLFAAVALAGGSTTESCAASAAFGSGGVSGKGVSPYDAGIGGGGVTENGYTGVAAAAPGVGAVVLQFT